MPSYDRKEQESTETSFNESVSVLPDYSKGLGNQGLLAKLGLGGLDSLDEGLPMVGDYDGKCRIPIILVSPATWVDELLVDVAMASKAAEWGVGNSPTVRMAQSGSGPSAVQVIEMVWPANWGAPVVGVGPQSSVLDAAMAVGGATEQLGWPKLTTTNQNHLNHLLGGVSSGSSVAARAEWSNRLNGGGWSSFSPQQQAQEMVDLLTSDSGRPELTDGDTSGMAQAKYTQKGPVTITAHSFRGTTADALEYSLVFEDGQTVKVYAPKAKTTKDTMHRHTVDQAAVAVAKLPTASRKVVVSVTLEAVQNPDDAYWAQEYNDPNFASYMTAGAAGEISIYPTSTSTPVSELEGSLIHETGHTWSMQQWGSDETKGKWLVWQKAMDSDVVSLSNYATNSLFEDVAETVQIYGMTKGTPEHQEYRRMVPERFGILDRELK